MFSVSHLYSLPIHVSRKRMAAWQPRKSSILDAPPPPSVIDTEPCLGEYCIKATVEQIGQNPKTYMGYSQNIDIGIKTLNACERFKSTVDKCTEPDIVFKGCKCDEVIFVRTHDGVFRMIR